MEIKELLQNDIHTVEQANTDNFVKSDFKNLFSMRSKLLSFADYSRRKLLCKLTGLLDFDVISRVDTTSAYVWLAINLKRVAEEGLRDRISGASASILATPMDLRIYMDFGGQSVIAREDYYSFLGSKEYISFIEVHNDEALKMFDIDWYSFIVNSNGCPADFLNPYFAEQLQRAKILLQESREKNEIITWNRNLIGFILPRTENIAFSDINEKLEAVIKLYFCFIEFRLKKNGNNVGLLGLLPDQNYLLNKTNNVLEGYSLKQRKNIK